MVPAVDYAPTCAPTTTSNGATGCAWNTAVFTTTYCKAPVTTCTSCSSTKVCLTTQVKVAAAAATPGSTVDVLATAGCPTTPDASGNCISNFCVSNDGCLAANACDCDFTKCVVVNRQDATGAVAPFCVRASLAGSLDTSFYSVTGTFTSRASLPNCPALGTTTPPTATGSGDTTVDKINTDVAANSNTASSTAATSLAAAKVTNALASAYSVVIVAVANPVKNSAGGYDVTLYISLIPVDASFGAPTDAHLQVYCDAFVKVYVAKALNIDVSLVSATCTWTATGTSKRAIQQSYQYQSGVGVNKSAFSSSFGLVSSAVVIGGALLLLL